MVGLGFDVYGILRLRSGTAGRTECLSHDSNCVLLWGIEVFRILFHRNMGRNNSGFCCHCRKDRLFEELRVMGLPAETSSIRAGRLCDRNGSIPIDDVPDRISP